MTAAKALSLAGAALMVSLAAGCAGPGCSTSTDPATCRNTEDVNNYNRARQLNQAPPGPQYPDQYQMMDRAGRNQYRPYYGQ
ncbi:MAG TPA: hypothetical protein VGB82_21445 [Alphaproteobacteria bacterium]